MKTITAPTTIQKIPELTWMTSKLLENNVESLVVVGSYHGGAEWHIARAYAAMGKKISMTSIDPVDCVQRRQSSIEVVMDFKQYHKFINGTRDAFPVGEKADAVFIDGDHSYSAVKKDFNFAINVAKKMIIFHDIVNSLYHQKHGCWVSTLWDEIKKSGFKTEEMMGDDWAGIGIIYHQWKDGAYV
jgi:hypothetical protein